MGIEAMVNKLVIAGALAYAASAPFSHAESKGPTYKGDDLLQAYTCGALDLSAGFRGSVNEEPKCENIPPPMRLAAMDAGKSLAKAVAEGH
jgi:hypothetical protein